MPSLVQLLIAFVAPAILHLAAIRAGLWRPELKRGLKTRLGTWAVQNLWSLFAVNGTLVAAFWIGANELGFIGATIPIALLAVPAGLQAMVAWESIKQFYLNG